MPTYRRTFPGLPEEVSRARHWARAVLGTHPSADDAALIVTELSANAITHTHSAGTSFHLTVTDTDDGTVTISVTDMGGATTTPRIKCPGNDATGGRGLALVTAYAAAVYISGNNNGHTVTAELRPARAEQVS